MPSKPILTRGDKRLNNICEAVITFDSALQTELATLHSALAEFRASSGFGRAIAAPQLGILKRAIAVNLGATPFALINPEVTWRSEEKFAVWDDCLSEPDRIVKVMRHCSISIRYQDLQGRERQWQNLNADMSELVQHELDHLDGVLMSERAIDADSIRPISERDALIGSARPSHRLRLSAIADAAQLIDRVFKNMPQYNCSPLSTALACELTIKVESNNPIRSFKGRGADNFVQQILQRGETRALVCASAGNFGQAMAYACRKHGLPMIIYAAETANPFKVQRMRDLGADVRLSGDDFDAAKAAAREYANKHQAWMVEDGEEIEISEGAGSIAVELLQHDAIFDAVFIPVGNGALINGMARWIKAASPATRVVGICADQADAMYQSWRQGKTVINQSANTIADGIAVRVPVDSAVQDMLPLVDEMLLVSEAPIIAAMRLVFEHAGLLVEPAGVVGVAAILAYPEKFSGLQIATILCGSNLTHTQIREWIC